MMLSAAADRPACKRALSDGQGILISRPYEKPLVFYIGQVSVEISRDYADRKIKTVDKKDIPRRKPQGDGG
jgi:hypothetical protein